MDCAKYGVSCFPDSDDQCTECRDSKAEGCHLKLVHDAADDGCCRNRTPFPS